MRKPQAIRATAQNSPRSARSHSSTRFLQFMHCCFTFGCGLPGRIRPFARTRDCFLVLGLWLLSRAARQLGGEESSNALVWLGALWPFGFHYGRLAGPYAFAFLLIAAVTWQYFRWIALRSPSGWIVLRVIFASALHQRFRLAAPSPFGR